MPTDRPIHERIDWKRCTKGVFLGPSFGPRKADLNKTCAIDGCTARSAVDAHERIYWHDHELAVCNPHRRVLRGLIPAPKGLRIERSVTHGAR